MKIAYLSTAPLARSRANVIQVLRMCAAFSNLGNELTLIADTRGIDAKSLRDKFGIRPNFRLHHLPARRIRGYSVYLAPRSAQVAVSLNPDIIYTRNLRACACVALLGKPVVYEAHALPGGLIDRAALRLAEATGRLQGIVSISSALNSALESKAPRLVAHDAANAPWADGFPGVWPQSNKPFVGYAGSAYPGKGADFIVRLARYRPDLQFEAVGPAKSDLEPDEGELPRNLRLVGKIPAGEVQDRLSNYDILLAPYSRSVSSAGGQEICQWMSPLKIFEYMASCRPMVASELPVLREVLTDGHNALLRHPDNVQAWSDALDLLISNPSLAKELAEKAHSDLLDNYTWDSRARLIIDFITQTSK